MKVLVVTNPFGGHEKGHRITDPTAIEQTLAGEHAHHVVQADHAIELQPIEHGADPAEHAGETTSEGA